MARRPCVPTIRRAEKRDAKACVWDYCTGAVPTFLKLAVLDVCLWNFSPGQPYLTKCIFLLTLFTALDWICGLSIDFAWIVCGFLTLLLLPLLAMLYLFWTKVCKIVMTDFFHLDSVYSREGCLFVVAECCGGKIVGFVGVERLNSQSAELVHMYVHPSHRKCGLGVRLINEIENFCVSKAFDDIRLNTFDRNHAAQRLYEKAGFKYLETVSFPVGAPFCALTERFYVKPLRRHVRQSTL